MRDSPKSRRHQLVLASAKEIKPGSLAHIPNFCWSLSSLQGGLFLKATKSATWPTHSPECQQYGDFAPFRRCVDGVWWKRLGTLLSFLMAGIGDQATAVFVVRTYKRSALVWPMIPAERDVLTLASLFWTHLFCVIFKQQTPRSL